VTMQAERADQRPYSPAEANRRAYDYLARSRSSASAPWPQGTQAAQRSWLDEFGWLPWDDLRTVLVLCGAGGQQAPAFAALGLQVTVVDISEGQLAIDRRVAARRGFDIECVRADVQDLSALAGRTFDLVYHPVSTCYLPDPRACYRAVARLLRPGGLYLSDHWNPAQMQLADPAWDGSGYRLVHRAGSGSPLRIVDPSTADGPDCQYFAHRLQDLIGGICEAGFVIERFAERGLVDGQSQPGTREHLGAYLAPFYEVLARRVPDRSATRNRFARPRRRGPLVGRPLTRTDLAQRWRRNGFVVLRGILEPDRLVPALRQESADLRATAVESTWDSYGLSDDGSYVSGGMQFMSALPGSALTRLHQSAQLQALVRAVTGNDRIVASENVAYMYYDDTSFIDVHTDVPQCEVTALTSVIGRTPPLIAYPRLRDLSPQRLLAVARRTGGRPPGGVALEVPVGGLLLIDGRRLPHRRPAVLPGEGAFGIAALCYIERPAR
jgi:SAM-dependent methyltransferase